MKTRRLLIAIVLVLLILSIPPLLFLNRPGAAPLEQAQAAMQSTADVEVSSNRWITFTPANHTPTVGFIFYPGAKVDPQAYAPVLHAVADQGFLVVDVPMPFDLAVFGPNKAKNVIAAYPEIEIWVIGGHSLGGVMAAEFADSHEDLVDGLAFWAAYPAEGTPLTESNLVVISISGTLDGLSSPERIAESIPLLPAGTIWVPIEGGNHAQFGDYGPQSGDLPAEISPEEQQSQVVDAMVDFLSGLTP